MSSLAIIKDDRYLEHNPGDGHPESPYRLQVIHHLLDREFHDLPLVPPRLATEDELALIHDPFYIRTVANTAGRVHSQLDPDTGLSARSYETARLAAGGLLQAVDALFAPPHSAFDIPHSAFAFVRPPGHHAEPAHGMGFCLFNNVAIAAEYAKKRYGLQRILIVDWDLHHGNGTQRAFYDDPGVLYFSSHQYPYYPGSGNFSETGTGEGEGFTMNAPFPAGFGDAEYLHVYRTILTPVALEYKPELVLVSAGFDPSNQDPLGSMEVSADGFGVLASLVKDIADACCGGRVLLSLEGGYDPQGLRDGVRSVLQALLGSQAPLVWKTPVKAAELVIKGIINEHKQFWKCLRHSQGS